MSTHQMYSAADVLLGLVPARGTSRHPPRHRAEYQRVCYTASCASSEDNVTGRRDVGLVRTGAAAGHGSRRAVAP